MRTSSVARIWPPPALAQSRAPLDRRAGRSSRSASNWRVPHARLPTRTAERGARARPLRPLEPLLDRHPPRRIAPATLSKATISPFAQALHLAPAVPARGIREGPRNALAAGSQPELGAYTRPELGGTHQVGEQQAVIVSVELIRHEREHQGGGSTLRTTLTPARPLHRNRKSWPAGPDFLSRRSASVGRRLRPASTVRRMKSVITLELAVGVAGKGSCFIERFMPSSGARASA